MPSPEEDRDTLYRQLSDTAAWLRHYLRGSSPNTLIPTWAAAQRIEEIDATLDKVQAPPTVRSTLP